MKIPDIDESVKLGKIFWITYAVMAIPSLLLLRPWSWDGPIISILAGIVLPPFLVSIVLYSCVLFAVSVTAKFHEQKQRIVVAAFAIIVPAIFLLVAWVFSGFQKLPAVFAFAASFLGYSSAYNLHRKRPNQPPEPTAPSGRG